MIKVGGIQITQVLWQAVFLAASPLASSGEATKTFFRARLQYRQLRRLTINGLFALTSKMDFAHFLCVVRLSRSYFKTKGQLSIVFLKL